jgi:signal transduction histidine kinase
MLEPVARFNGALWLALGILAAGLVIAALVQVFVGLAPLRKLRAALGRVRKWRCARLEGEFPVEITPLVDEFNSVLEQNAEVVERARTQAGNLAHALKTPLSVLANAAAGKDDELARLVVARSMRPNARCTTTWRVPSRGRRGASAGARTPLRPVLEGLLRTMRRIHAERQLELLLHPIAENLAFRGEEQDLQEMLGNLLDNACKWASRRVESRRRATESLLIPWTTMARALPPAPAMPYSAAVCAPTSRCRVPGWACRLSTIWRSSTAASSRWPIRRSVACGHC